MLLAEIEHAAGGKLRGPDNFYDIVTSNTVDKIGSAFPASKGEVRASEAILQAELNVTTAVVNALVAQVNALTPVGC